MRGSAQTSPLTIRSRVAYVRWRLHFIALHIDWLVENASSYVIVKGTCYLQLINKDCTTQKFDCEILMYLMFGVRSTRLCIYKSQRFQNSGPG